MLPCKNQEQQLTTNYTNNCYMVPNYKYITEKLFRLIKKLKRIALFGVGIHMNMTFFYLLLSKRTMTLIFESINVYLCTNRVSSSCFCSAMSLFTLLRVASTLSSILETSFFCAENENTQILNVQ